MHRIDHGARINHDNRAGSPLTCSGEGPAIIVMPGMARLHGYLAGASR
jgi:hypothetical protein